MFRLWQQDRKALVAAAIAAAFVGGGFVAATTYIGDDHLFLAFALYVRNPLVAFIRDLHGGEYYRPLPMLVWWVFGRLTPAGAHVPFALLSFGLHTVAALQVAALAEVILASPPGAHPRSGQPGARLAAALFFLAPLTQEAAFWFSASTDLFATVFVLAALRRQFRGHSWTAMAWFMAACLSKESVLAMPLFAGGLIRFTSTPRRTWSSVARQSAGLIAVSAVYLAIRTWVLGGVGRSGDPPAPFLGKMLQILSGMAHLVSGEVLAAEGLAWILGGAALLALLVGTAHVWRTSASPMKVEIGLPLLWILLTTAPLLAASWVMGARYFYLPAVGFAWLGGLLLQRLPRPVGVAVLSALLGLDLAQVLARRADVRSYDARLAASARAVADGVAHGYRVFHIAAGVKDLDLALKRDLRLRSVADELLVLGDVPASFVAAPEGGMASLQFLAAQPPLPPSGAYRFGDHHIIGLARRGDEPTLDEVLARYPAMRFIRLRLGPEGRVIARDVTESLLQQLPDD